MHMPWWEAGVETTKRMVISYDNLIVRLWLSGCIMPYVDGGYAEEHFATIAPKDSQEDTTEESKTEKDTTDNNNSNNTNNNNHVDTLILSNGLPPIPHPHWVDRLGFQQTDPVTDFRSGGILSLALQVHIVEKCPNVHARFLPSGNTHMLPFGITCINVTDMIAKFCMFSRSTNQVDALVSQKPFWRMFEDPNCLLVLQELGMDMLCDVVVELGKERQMAKASLEKAKKDGTDTNATSCCHDGRVNNDDGIPRFHGQDMEHKVTVFDFAEILARTEKRVEIELLGSGPKTVADLRRIHQKCCTKYKKAMDRKERQAQRDTTGTAGDVLFKLKEISLSLGTSTHGESKNNNGDTKNKVIVTEEISFALAPEDQESSQQQQQQKYTNKGPSPSLWSNGNETTIGTNNYNVDDGIDEATTMTAASTTTTTTTTTNSNIFNGFSIDDEEDDVDLLS